MMQSASDTLFKTLANPTRRAIYERIVQGGAQTVHALTARSGVSQPAVSKHLGVLKKAGLVAPNRTGRETRYSAMPDGLAPIAEWMKVYHNYWNEQLDQLESLLKRID